MVAPKASGPRRRDRVGSGAVVDRSPHGDDDADVLLFLWATPRSTSTAFEWVMRQRGDFRCFHEPFNEAFHYGEDRRSQPDAHVPSTPGVSFDSVWADIDDAAMRRPVFVKDFAYSILRDLPDPRLDAIQHTFLVRDPRRVIHGLANHWPDCTREEVGFVALPALFGRVADRIGRPPPVQASADLLDNPDAAVQAYCDAVGIGFVPEAMAWDPGERTEVSWYGEGSGPWPDELRRSRGIEKPTTAYPPIDDDARLVGLFEEALPLYAELMAHKLAVRPGDLTNSPSSAAQVQATRARVRVEQ